MRDRFASPRTDSTVCGRPYQLIKSDVDDAGIKLGHFTPDVLLDYGSNL